MKHLFLIVLTIILFYCAEKSMHQKLSNDTTIKEFFTETEISKLSSLIEYTDSVVCTAFPKVKVDSAYHLYLDSLTTLIRSRVNNSPAIDQEKKHAFIFGLGIDFVHEIWRTDSIAHVIRVKDTVLRDLTDFPRLELTSRGKYMEYMQAVAERDTVINYIHSQVKRSGDLGCGLRFGCLIHNHKFNFEKIEQKLWISIFILTLEESYEKRVERYLNSKKTAE